MRSEKSCILLTLPTINKFIFKDKIFINIGGINNVLYGSRKSKKVIAIENEFFQKLSEYCKINCNNVIIDQNVDQNIDQILINYNINPTDISLIKININEDILDEMYQLSIKYNIPLYASFNNIEWKDTNLHKFTFLIEDQINLIKNSDISILFSN